MDINCLRKKSSKRTKSRGKEGIEEQENGEKENKKKKIKSKKMRLKEMRKRRN